MNKAESKYEHTAEKMDEAFLALLETKDFEYITVKEICSRAGVNRSTFYLHYETISDLLSESVEWMNAQFLAYFQADASGFVQQIRSAPREQLYLMTPEYLTPYLNYIREHRTLFKTSIEKAADLRMTHSFDLLCQHILLPILERYDVPEDQRGYMISFYIEGLIGIIKQWIAGDCEDPVDTILSVMRRVVKDGPKE